MCLQYSDERNHSHLNKLQNRTCLFLIVLKYNLILLVVHIYYLSPDPHPPMFEFVYLRHICRFSYLLCD